MITKTNRGFTFMELMVCVAIIGILSAIAIPSYIKYRERGLIAQATGDLKRIQRAVQDLGHDTGRWPTGSIAGVAKAMGTGSEVWDFSASALTTDPGWNDWQGPYLSGPFTDPWGMNYYFDEDYDIGAGNAAAVVASFGPDKVGPTTYDDNNIIVVIPAN
jgi:type II secretion system protein G